MKTSGISCMKDGNKYVERMQCNRMLKYNFKKEMFIQVSILYRSC
jgi:hypothetical protein